MNDLNPITIQESGPADLEAHALLYKACGDSLRLEILRVLKQDAFGVLELCALFGLRQPAMSHHLKVLSIAGLVETQREGNSIFYRRAAWVDEPLATARQQVYQQLDTLSLREEIVTNLKQVRQQRAQQSTAFFARHAHDFRSQQERVAEYQLYATQLEALIERLGLAPGETALEIGPGDGRFLEVLSRRFKRVLALDNSKEMLDEASAYCQSHRLDNITLIHGDSRDGVMMELQADLVVMNMVLHHVSSPAAVVEDCAGLLKPGGSLLVSELCHHDQQWTREACGDLWLGFDSQELSRWAQQSELEEGESLYLGVRNGFQVQIRHFVKPEPEKATSKNTPILVPLTQPPHPA